MPSSCRAHAEIMPAGASRRTGAVPRSCRDHAEQTYWSSAEIMPRSCRADVLEQCRDHAEIMPSRRTGAVPRCTDARELVWPHGASIVRDHAEIVRQAEVAPRDDRDHVPRSCRDHAEIMPRSCDRLRLSHGMTVGWRETLVCDVLVWSSRCRDHAEIMPRSSHGRPSFATCSCGRLSAEIMPRSCRDRPTGDPRLRRARVVVSVRLVWCPSRCPSRCERRDGRECRVCCRASSVEMGTCVGAARAGTRQTPDREKGLGRSEND